MCGIAGFSISEKDSTHIGCRVLTKHLLLQIEARGRDATGVAWVQNNTANDGVWFVKNDVPARDFVSQLSDIPTNTRSVICHTRYATQGDPSINENNHPIVAGNIVGVHNGHIDNDDEIFELLAERGVERIAQVDSEAIFQILANSDDPLEELGLLSGRAAIAWYDTDDDSVLHLARVSQSPLTVGVTHGGSTVFASTEHLLKRACFDAGVKLQTVFDVPESTYIYIVAGEIVEMVDLETKADIW